MENLTKPREYFELTEDDSTKAVIYSVWKIKEL